MCDLPSFLFLSFFFFFVHLFIWLGFYLGVWWRLKSVVQQTSHFIALQSWILPEFIQFSYLASGHLVCQCHLRPSHWPFPVFCSKITLEFCFKLGLAHPHSAPPPLPQSPLKRQQRSKKVSACKERGQRSGEISTNVRPRTSVCRWKVDEGGVTSWSERRSSNPRVKMRASPPEALKPPHLGGEGPWRTGEGLHVN